MTAVNDLIIPHLTADGRWIGSDAITAASAADDLAIPILTADGRQTLAKVMPCTAADDRCIEALTADRKKTLVKFAAALVTCDDFSGLDLTDISVSVSGFNLVLECYDGDYNPFNCDIANVYGATINGYTWTLLDCSGNPCIQPGALGYYSGCPTCDSNQGKILITCKTDGDGTYFQAQVNCNTSFAWPPCPGASMCWPDSAAFVRCASGSAQIVAGRLEIVMNTGPTGNFLYDWPCAQPGSVLGTVTFSGKLA
jgi:hypothetical protein